jgi:hypothetical protein
MKTRVFLLCFVSALTAYAADPPEQFNSTALKPLPLTEAQRMQIFTAKRDPPVITLGKSGFNLSGSLVYGFRPLPPQEDLTRAQRFLRLPLIRLFVPGPMPRPPETGGRYFAWRNEESPLPWTRAASRPAIIKGSESNPAVRDGPEIQKGILNIGFRKQ